MTYRTIKDLPTNIKNNLPTNAQELYKNTFNHAVEEFESTHDYESLANKVAWAAVKQKFHREANNQWVPNNSSTQSHSNTQQQAGFRSFQLETPQATSESNVFYASGREQRSGGAYRDRGTADYGSSHRQSASSERPSRSYHEDEDQQQYRSSSQQDNRRSGSQESHERRSEAAQHRERDEYGQFVSEDDNRNQHQRRSSGQDGYRSSSSQTSSHDRRSEAAQNRERDEYGQFVSEDDSHNQNQRRSSDYDNHRGSHSDTHHSRSEVAQHRDRDEHGRFVSEDERHSSSGHDARRSTAQDGRGQFAKETDNRSSSPDQQHQGGHGDRKNRNHQHHKSNS